MTTGNFERAKASWNIHEVEVLLSKHSMSDSQITVVCVSLLSLPFSASLDMLKVLSKNFASLVHAELQRMNTSAL